MQEQAMRLCMDCRFHVPKSSACFDRCLHRRSEYHEPVRGEINHTDCATMRVSGGPCGPDALLFAAKIASAA